jgi:hypothetical protein
MEYGQPHARVDLHPMFKDTLAPISLRRIWPLVTSGEEGGRGNCPPPALYLRRTNVKITECQVFFQSSELGPPTPSPARESSSSLLRVQGGRHTRLGGRGWGIPFPTKKRDGHSGTLHSTQSLYG